VVYEAFPQYFAGKPKVDRLEMPIVQEPATQLAMYQNGELDVVLVPLGDYPRLKADPRWSKEMKTWEARLDRSATLPKYDITIHPKKPRGG